LASRNVSRRTVALLGLAGLLVYVVWVGWPYFHAIVVRDAAVTSWISITQAPIGGYTTNPLHPGERAGADGRIATIADIRADTTELTRARADLARAQGRVVAQTAMIDAARRALEVRATHARHFAATFTRDLEVAVTNAGNSLVLLKRRLELEGNEVTRTEALHERDMMSKSQVDAAHAKVTDTRRLIVETQTALDRVNARLRAAKDGVFLLEDGTDGNSALQNLADARVRLLQAEDTLTQLRAEQEAAQMVVASTQAAYSKARSLDILVPPGAMVWSLISAPGASVQPGTPVASWVDCSIMLVDVPVSDVETALLRPGSIAHVVLEGERKTRTGTVILTRGSAGTLGSHDLAALAKGRRAGIGQALVKLIPSPDDIKACAIGHAAFVDFPEVNVIDLVRARLRW
jgi:multidrug resistance efflux pump